MLLSAGIENLRALICISITRPQFLASDSGSRGASQSLPTPWRNKAETRRRMERATIECLKSLSELLEIRLS